MLGGHQRSDKMERPLRDGVQVILGIIPLVENQRDITNTLAQDAASLCQFRGDARIGNAIVLVAGIGVMKQRNVTIGGNQQSQAGNCTRDE